MKSHIAAEETPLDSFCEKAEGINIAEAQRQQVHLMLRVEYLLRFSSPPPSSQLDVAKSGKSAALRRAFFGRWLTQRDDREHKSPDNDLCLSSHVCHFSFGQYLWLYAQILHGSLETELATREPPLEMGRTTRRLWGVANVQNGLEGRTRS